MLIAKWTIYDEVDDKANTMVKIVDIDQANPSDADLYEWMHKTFVAGLTADWHVVQMAHADRTYNILSGNESMKSQSMGIARIIDIKEGDDWE
jgi:hypothetical protein